jgi:epsilon-lactone hydrolase
VIRGHLPARDHGVMDPASVPYMIRINGHLGATVLSAFPALAPQHHGAHTVLTGLLDRSALYSVLAKVEALGLDLLEIQSSPPPSSRIRPQPAALPRARCSAPPPCSSTAWCTAAATTRPPCWPRWRDEPPCPQAVQHQAGPAGGRCLAVLRRSGRVNHCDPVTPPHLPGGKPGSGAPPGRTFQQRLDRARPPGGAATLIPTEGRSSVSAEQRETLDAILRQSAVAADGDVNEQRRQLRELLSAQPLPADVTVTAAALGGVPTAEITVDGIEPRHSVLYFHGGVYVMGDAFLAADLASQIGRRTRAKAISVDYRLAPEHPYPAAVDDALAAYEALLNNGTAPSDIVFAGESAGGGLAVATLVNARDHGLPLPAAAFAMSPYADLTLAGATMETKREADPLLSPQALRARVPDYTSGQDAALGLISPIFADLSGLPPLIIQAGTHEVLLDDAIRLARQAAIADVEVTLDITPGVPHVFQAYHAILDEAAAALDRAGQLLSAHLASA